MNILHIVKKAPDESTRKIMELQASGNVVKTVELYRGGVLYDKLIADVFAYDKIFCW
jgi:hypothetical protein